MPVVVERLTVPPGTTIEKYVVARMQALWREKLRAAVSRGFDPEPVVITDGVIRRDPDLVKPFGKIEFVRRVDLTELVFWINAELYRRSPVGPEAGGHYRNDHMLRINGAVVTGNWRVALRDVKGGDLISIVNPRPYARKLEGAAANEKTGRGYRKPSSRQAPSGIYRPVVAEIVRKYSKSVYAEYKLVNLGLGVMVWGDIGGRYKTVGKGRNRKSIEITGKAKRIRREQVYPAITLFVKPSQVM